MLIFIRNTIEDQKNTFTQSKMLTMQIDKKMLPMKLHYFLYLGSISSITAFLPTIAKQMGYSPEIVGCLYTYVSILALIFKPIFGFIVDKLPVKKIVFLMCLLSSGLAAFSLIFVQKLPTENIANLRCHTTTVLNICSENNDELSECVESLSKLSNNSEPITCQLYCLENQLFWDEICESWNIKDYCTTTNSTIKNNNIELLDVVLFTNATDQVEAKSSFTVKSLKFEKKQVQSPNCQRPVNNQCKINCTNDVVMKLAAHPISKGIFASHQFQKFFIIITLFWISQAVVWSLQDSICFNILGDKPENFGKQRCWGSISWGLFTILGGVLVDYFSKNDLEKNYDPIFYLCLICILSTFAIDTKIKVTETYGIKIKLSDLFKLFTKLNAIIYFAWIILTGIFTSMVWNYLFWYMEDITMKYHSDKQPWIKTLQGLTIGIQTTGGEMLFLMLSGWIIKQLGHWNCMALGLFSFSVKFYLYSIITNPVWILPVEILNGVTFGLSYAVLVSYAAIIAPESAVSTLIGFSGALLEGVGVSLGGLIGGILYDNYKGAQTFKLFSYSSLTMCILLVIYIKFIKTVEEDKKGDSTDLKLDQKTFNSKQISH